jgi:phage baseplate assembly protein W
MMAMPITWDGYVRASEFGANWRVQFNDADGTPLSMISFEQIDFGAISYKEIFQNCKTILATPLLSTVLERTLGVDWEIVDLPVDKAAEATVAIMDALYFWEPRAEVMNIDFDADINGRLTPNIQLKIRNVIFGTQLPYDKTSIYPPPAAVQVLPSPTPPPPSEGGGDVIFIPGPEGPPGPTGPPGATGATGPRGSLWFTGPSDPGVSASAQAQDMYLNTTTAAIFQYDGTTWRVVFNGMAT